MKNKNREEIEEFSELQDKVRLYQYLAGFFKTLANPTRLQILQLLSEGEDINNRRLSEKNIREGFYKLISTLCEVRADPTRIEILDLLYSHGRCQVLEVAEIISQTQRKPHIINYHLDKLIEYGLVKRVKRRSYQITEIGVSIWAEISIADMFTITEKAIEIGKTEELIN